ncbi:MAG: uncharacterized membrane protein YjjP (DUF1212 family) [Acidimicrobiales bacterium]|jgi:uncharacterized membrane protein YjjP (DUF1212 family)
MLTAFGILSASTMVVAYGFEQRHPRWIIVFAIGCLSTAIYGVITGAWVFAVLEALWSVLAVHRFTQQESSQ